MMMACNHTGHHSCVCPTPCLCVSLRKHRAPSLCRQVPTPLERRPSSLSASSVACLTSGARALELGPWQVTEDELAHSASPQKSEAEPKQTGLPSVPGFSSGWGLTGHTSLSLEKEARHRKEAEIDSERRRASDWGVEPAKVMLPAPHPSLSNQPLLQSQVGSDGPARTGEQRH